MSALLAAPVFVGHGVAALQEAGVVKATAVGLVELPLLGIHATARRARLAGADADPDRCRVPVAKAAGAGAAGAAARLTRASPRLGFPGGDPLRSRKNLLACRFDGFLGSDCLAHFWCSL
ncbi:hypothetical protein [Ramlibacter lithotrophicus]|uniref:hypothetical protein n=1 Tax=Ramlibacter lithotrophicus TaxID=2606681 RepID=UPI001EE395FA|nr:hypothetical protein [Ramlibacter lithotrophicus]